MNFLLPYRFFGLFWLPMRDFKSKWIVLYPTIQNFGICTRYDVTNGQNNSQFWWPKSQLWKLIKRVLWDRFRFCLQLICFSETWRELKDSVLPDIDYAFVEFHEPGLKNHVGGRPSGGLSLIVRKTFLKYFCIAHSDSYHFWCKVAKEGFG